MNKNRVAYSGLAIALLLIGMAIYLLFRDLSNMLMFKWIKKPSFAEQALLPLEPSILSNTLKFHVPDVLWFVSAIMLFRVIWFYNLRMQKRYVVCFICFAVFFEAIQVLDTVPGTFDWLDLLGMGIGAFFESLFYKKVFRRKLI